MAQVSAVQVAAFREGWDAATPHDCPLAKLIKQMKHMNHYDHRVNKLPTPEPELEGEAGAAGGHGKATCTELLHSKTYPEATNNIPTPSISPELPAHDGPADEDNRYDSCLEDDGDGLEVERSRRGSREQSGNLGTIPEHPDIEGAAEDQALEGVREGQLAMVLEWSAEGASSATPVGKDCDVDMEDPVESHPSAPIEEERPAVRVEEQAEDHSSALIEEERADVHAEEREEGPAFGGMPLSRAALSSLNASNTITPDMLAKHHLPEILLGNGSRKICYIMNMLTQNVPGFSRIQHAKARRIVNAALEGRKGGGINGDVIFYKTGWGRWDAYVKGSPEDSAFGSFEEGHLSLPRSEGSYATSFADSGVHMDGGRRTSACHDQQSWTVSSVREEDEDDMDMNQDQDPYVDALMHQTENMSLDEASTNGDLEDSGDETEDESVIVPHMEVPRKASVPTPDALRKDYNAISAAYARRHSFKSRRPSMISGLHSIYSSSAPYWSAQRDRMRRLSATLLPDEDPMYRDAVAALTEMRSMRA
jgi:hypothetical protein